MAVGAGTGVEAEAVGWGAVVALGTVEPPVGLLVADGVAVADDPHANRNATNTRTTAIERFLWNRVNDSDVFMVCSSNT